MSTRAPFTFRPRVFPLEGVLDGGQLLSSLGQLRGAVLLDSAAGKPQNFTLMGFEPLMGVDLPGCFEDLGPFCASIVFEEGADPVPGPFQGGFIGALAYDLGVPGEELDLPREAGLRAPILGGLYVDFVVTDHSTSESFLVLGHDPGDERPSVPERFAKVQELLARPRVSELRSQPDLWCATHRPTSMKNASVLLRLKSQLESTTRRIWPTA